MVSTIIIKQTSIGWIGYITIFNTRIYALCDADPESLILKLQSKNNELFGG